MKRLIWQRTGGYWLFYTSVVYLIISFLNLAFHWTRPESIQVGFILAISLPLWIKPLACWLNMKCLWEN